MNKIDIEQATDNEQRIIEMFVKQLTDLAHVIRLTPREEKKTRSYGVTFGRYVEAKWALGYTLLLVVGMPNVAQIRTECFDYANAYLEEFAPRATIYVDGKPVQG